MTSDVVAYAVRDELTSPKWARAFAKGCGARVAVRDELEAGAVALFGSPRRQRLLDQAKAEGRTWFYGDHAYFRRHEFYRCTRNAMQHDGHGEGDPRRLERLEVRIRGWRKDGTDVLLCPNSPAFFEGQGLRADVWIRETVAELRRHTDRPIRVRFKNDGGDLEQALRGAWATVVYVSVSGMHSALAGIPCFATAPCASLSFGSSDLSRIESPARPDNRHELASVLANQQWTLLEMANGKAWEAVR